MRKFEFQNEEYYHIYNRGVDKRNIFVEEKDFIRFLTCIREFNDTTYKNEREFNKRKNSSKLAKLTELSSVNFLPKLVQIICYCLNQNHYHLILKQLTDNGVKTFMHKLGTGYTNYFNLKYSRSGSLFQGSYKAIHINSNDYLLWLSGYINGNPEIHKLAEANNYLWSSYQDYIGLRSGTLCDKKEVLNQFKNKEDYKEFVQMIIKDSSESKEEIRKYILE